MFTIKLNQHAVSVTNVINNSPLKSGCACVVRKILLGILRSNMFDAFSGQTFEYALPCETYYYSLIKEINAKFELILFVATRRRLLSERDFIDVSM